VTGKLARSARSPRHHDERNTIPDDRAVVRHVGTPRGQRRANDGRHEEGEFETIATLMSRALRHRDDDAIVTRCAPTSRRCARRSTPTPTSRSSRCTTFSPYVAVIAVGAGRDLGGNVPARKISLRIGYTALPDERKVHQVTTPYGGGAAMLVGFCVALAVAMAIPALRNIILFLARDVRVLLARRDLRWWVCWNDFREMSDRRKSPVSSSPRRSCTSVAPRCTN